MYLLISSPRNLESPAYTEMKILLRDVGIAEFERKKMLISGLVLIQIQKNPLQVVRELHAILKDDPWRLKVVSKIKPIEVIVDTRLDLLGEAVDEFVPRILPEESFKIELTRRRHHVKSNVLIAELAQRFENPVDLETPSKILLVEVFGSNTGLSVCLPSDIISLSSLRRGK